MKFRFYLIPFLATFLIHNSAFAQLKVVKTFTSKYNLFKDWIAPKLLDNGNIVFVLPNDSINDMHLYSSDGTESGTKMISSCGKQNFNPYGWDYGVYSDGKNFYSIGQLCQEKTAYGVYKTDGNSITFSDLTTTSYQDWHGMNDSVSIGDNIYFFAYMHIYKYNKSTGSTTVVHKANGYYPYFSFLAKDGTDLILYGSNPASLYRFNTLTNEVIPFFGLDDFYASERFSTSSRVILDNNISELTNYTYPVYYWKGSSYFIVNYKGKDNKAEYALWKTDGTAAGTMELERVKGFINSPTGAPYHFMPYKDKLYFRFMDKTRSGLWVTDGTPQGTDAVKAFNDDTTKVMTFNWYIESNLVVLNDKLYFAAKSRNTYPNNVELWESDGTTQGTKKAMEFVPGVQGLGIYGINPYIHVYKNRMYFLNTGLLRGDVVTSDGTTQGTYSLGGASNGLSGRNNQSLVFKDGFMYFMAGGNNKISTLYKVNVDNPKPLFLNEKGKSVELGKEITVTGFDLRNTSANGISVSLFSHDEANTPVYIYSSSIQRINDTTIRFTIPSDLGMTKFRIAVYTDAGSFLSPGEYTIGEVIGIEDEKKSTQYKIAQNDNSLIISFTHSKKHDIKVVDITGRILHIASAQDGKNVVLNTKLYIPGMYIIQIDNSSAEKVFFR